MRDALRSWTLPRNCTDANKVLLHRDLKRDIAEAIIAFSVHGVGEARFRRALGERLSAGESADVATLARARPDLAALFEDFLVLQQVPSAPAVIPEILSRFARTLKSRRFLRQLAIQVALEERALNRETREKNERGRCALRG